MIWAPICIPSAFLQPRNTKLRSHHGLVVSVQPHHPYKAGLNVKAGREAAIQSGGCNLSLFGSCKRSVLLKVTPCRRLFASPGCWRKWQSRAESLLPAASRNSLFITKDEASCEACKQLSSAGNIQQPKPLWFLQSANEGKKKKTNQEIKTSQETNQIN